MEAIEEDSNQLRGRPVEPASNQPSPSDSSVGPDGDIGNSDPEAAGRSIEEASSDEELSSCNLEADVPRNELAKMIIKHEYPLNMVEKEGFIGFIRSLNPFLKMVSVDTVESDCLDIFYCEKTAAMELLDKIEGRVAITTDMWTSSCQERSFMAVTAHYIDNNWELQSRLIRFIFVPSSQTSEVLCNALSQCLEEWNLGPRLSTITTEDSTTNDSMIDMLKKKFPKESLLLNGNILHMRCSARMLTSIVEDGLEMIGDTIDRIRDSVAFWLETQNRRRKFEETACELRTPTGKKLVLDCETGWNSTYLMLQTALEYKEVFLLLKQRKPRYECFPTETDWEVAKEICIRLKLFHKAAEVFSVKQLPATYLYFSRICDIMAALNGWVNSEIDVIAKISASMSEKFDKCWSTVHGIMGVAILLDPRYKRDFLDYCFRRIYGDSDEAEKRVQHIISTCRELFVQYEGMEQHKDDNNGSLPMEVSEVADRFDILSEFLVHQSQKKRKLVRSELDMYLEEEVVTETGHYDILAWWKINRSAYPVLYKIARDILAIPVSTVLSKSTSSTSERLISPHRSELHPDTVEALTCARNWLWANSKGNSAEEEEHATMLYDEDDDADIDGNELNLDGNEDWLMTDV